MAVTKDFASKLVISISDGKNLGEIKDVYLDKDVTKVTALHLGKSGIINRKSLIVDLSHIRLMGIDAWLTDNSDCVIAKDEVSGADSFILADDLRGREIQTDGGTRLGTVSDIIVDSGNSVLGFSFGKLLVEGPLSETRAIARAAITSPGDKDNPMIAALEQAERLKLTF